MLVTPKISNNTKMSPILALIASARGLDNSFNVLKEGIIKINHFSLSDMCNILSEEYPKLDKFSCYGVM